MTYTMHLFQPFYRKKVKVNLFQRRCYWLRFFASQELFCRVIEIEVLFSDKPDDMVEEFGEFDLFLDSFVHVLELAYSTSCLHDPDDGDIFCLEMIGFLELCLHRWRTK